MKIAIMSDIHGNLEALKTALEDMKRRKVEKIFCLGDIVEKGCHAEECVKLVRENCDVVVQGNCDVNFDPMVYRESKHNIPVELLQKRAKWLNDLLSREAKEYLLGLPFSYEFFMSRKFGTYFSCASRKENGSDD